MTSPQLLVAALLAAAAATASGAVPPPTRRPLCEPGAQAPPNRFNSTLRLRRLREHLRLGGDGSQFYLQTDRDRFLAAPQPHEQFRTWLSGFAGTAGSVLVSANAALLFTDSRYTVQADQELLCHWQVYDSLPLAAWLAAASAERPLTLLLDAKQVSAEQYSRLRAMQRLTLRPLARNPVDEMWLEGRPPAPQIQVYPLGQKYTGQTWAAKVERTRAWQRQHSVPYLAVTALDETAYLLNLRGTVVAYKPYFASLVLLSQTQLHIFFDDWQSLLQGAELKRHFEAFERLQPQFHNLGDLADALAALPPDDRRVSLPLAATSQSVVAAFTNASFVVTDATSPVRDFKAVKNSAEQAAYTDCSLTDSAALVAFLHELDTRMAAGEQVTELSAAARLREFRALVADFRGLSFEAIAAAGPNAAVVHYRPSAATNRRLTHDEAFLLDSGGQYLGCTTDVTRTMYYGATPPQEVREAYTRVLGGVIDLFNLTWPQRVDSLRFDALARRRLWAGGMDYGHGTGHGIGLFLSVHEGPNGIGRQVPLQVGHFQSIEPGYYRRQAPGRRGFGIRLETITGVRTAAVSSQEAGEYLQFAPVTWVPFESKLIVLPMLTDSQLAWLNWYHAECRRRLQQPLADLRQADAMRWVQQRTQPFTRSGHSLRAAWPLVAAACIVGVWQR